MVAKLQRAIVILLLLAAAGLSAFLSHVGMTMWAIAVGFASLVVHAPLLALELLCAWHVEVPASRPSVSDLIRAWWGEVLTAPTVFYWRQPFRSHTVSDDLPPTPNGRRGVLLVHGLLCNRGFWTPWALQLRRIGCPHLAVDLEPIFGSIDTYAEAIERAVTRLQSSTGLPPVIVAHSMGGLAVRRWLVGNGTADRVHRVITIGTPHHGTWLARMGHSLNSRQMMVGSHWLRDLASSELSQGHKHFTCFYGVCDNVVFPSANSQLAGADNRRIDRTAHVALAFKEEVFAEALRYLEPLSTPVER